MGGSSIYGALAVSYVVAVVGVQGSVGALSLVFAPLLGAAMVPLAGILGDRYGRIIVYRGFAIFQLLIAFPVLVGWIPLAGYVALLTLDTIITTFFTPEPRGRDLDDLRDAVDAK